MIFKAFGLLYLSVVACFGQSAIEPDIADVFWRFDDGKLVPLERQATGTTHGKVGFGSMKITAQLPGGKSPVRFRVGELLEFIVRSPMAVTTDPATIYSLWNLDAKKDRRELVMMTSSGSLFHATTKTGQSLGKNMTVEFSTYGEWSVKMSTKDLPPGEYAVGRLGGQAVFCFGVDK
jgi:hypothetical protein